jgi:3',5'-cyclic AMP phosphodiesterase CpdA
MLTLGVISDVHFGPEARFAGKLRKLSLEAPRLCEAFGDQMRTTVGPDLVVNLGDVVEDASPAADRQRYHDCLAILARAGAPLVHVAGNHDLVHIDAPTLRAAWGLPPTGALYRSFDHAGVHLVVLHTSERRDRDVRIDAAQLDWLARDLAATALPTVVLMHHSAADQDLRGNRWFAAAPELCLVAERARLRGILAASGKVRLVLNGHLHWNHFDLCEGLPMLTLQSLTENVADDAPGTPAATWAVVRIDGDRVAIEVAGVEPARYQLHRSGPPGAAGPTVR